MRKFGMKRASVNPVSMSLGTVKAAIQSVGLLGLLLLTPACAAQDVAPAPKAEAVKPAPAPTAGPAKSALSPDLLKAVVRIDAHIPSDARTAASLGSNRTGSGVLIDGGGLVVTIGYLITEAMAVEVTVPGGKPVLASIVGFDNDTGLGLLRTDEPLAIKPIPLARSGAITEKQAVLVASFDQVQAATVASRRAFAGTWEYLLDQAIFTTPPHMNWGGAALIGADGRLLGIGSLLVKDAVEPNGTQGVEAKPGNMFVPIDVLPPILGDLIALGRKGDPPRPWLGLNLQPLGYRLVVARVSEDGPAEKAGLRRGDVVAGIGGEPVRTLADFYQKLWAQGTAGVAVPLTVLQGGEPRQLKVETIDRYKYLKLNTSY